MPYSSQKKTIVKPMNGSTPSYAREPTYVMPKKGDSKLKLKDIFDGYKDEKKTTKKKKVGKTGK
mgnify:CR=1 FL=1